MSSHMKLRDPSMHGARRWRTDVATASIIDQSLALQACRGTHVAAALLHSNGIDINVAIRVLGRSSQRRKAPALVLLPQHIYGSVPALIYRQPQP